MARTPPTKTFQERIDAIRVDCASISDRPSGDTEQELHFLSGIVSDVAELVGVLADLQGNGPATEAAARLPASRGGKLEFQITAQRAADSNDPRAVLEFEGDNFSNLVRDAELRGYPRIISGVQREVTEWQAITAYPFAESTP